MTTLYDAVIEEGAKFDIKPADDSKLRTSSGPHTLGILASAEQGQDAKENFRAQLGGISETKQKAK